VQIGDRVREGDPLLTLDCPDAADMRAAVESAPASLREAHSALDRERLPIPAFSAGTQMTHEVTGTSTLFGFSMPLPLFDRNQGAIAKARHKFGPTISRSRPSSPKRARISSARPPSLRNGARR
jgi:outer membrane protein, heavy metal efflux system